MSIVVLFVIHFGDRRVGNLVVERYTVFPFSSKLGHIKTIPAINMRVVNRQIFSDILKAKSDHIFNLKGRCHGLCVVFKRLALLESQNRRPRAERSAWDLS